jgi:antitoxin ParD1/3/4
MPTQNVNLSDQHTAFIQSTISSGQFCNASEVVRAGLRALEQQIQEDALKLKALKRLAKEGFDAIERGEFIAVSYDEIDRFLDTLS